MQKQIGNEQNFLGETERRDSTLRHRRHAHRAETISIFMSDFSYQGAANPHRGTANEAHLGRAG